MMLHSFNETLQHTDIFMIIIDFTRHIRDNHGIIGMWGRMIKNKSGDHKLD